MNIQTFSFANQSLQIIIKDNQAWFIAREVANLLGYRDAHNLTRILDDDEKGTHNMSTLGGNQDVTIINESGFYHAAFKSRKAEVKPFRKWVTNEVLPSIRKTGSYTVSGNPKKLSNKTTTTERTGLRNAVNLLVSKMNYSEAYNLVHQRFNVESIEDLSHSQLNEAVEYVHRVILEGEVLDKPKTLTCPDPALLHNTLANTVEHFRDYGKLLQVLDKLPLTDSRMAFNTFNHVQEVCENIMKIATDWGLKSESGKPIFEPCRINFYNGAAVAW